MENLKPGDVFDERFRIQSKLGQGGMGTVYHAKQIDVDRDVAIKLLHFDPSSFDEDRKRFWLREVKTLSQLSHESIVTIYAAAVTKTGIPFTICEFMEGETLSSILSRETKMGWQRSCKIAEQICAALQAAHDIGIIHRDLKPGNVMIMHKPEPDWVKVFDFGLANIVSENRAENPSLTLTGELVGTPHYMSPEQCRGSRADARSDIYALGCLIFECITGEKLFDADSPVGILYKHSHENPGSRLSAAQSLIPQKLLDILRSCLSKEIGERYQSMEDLRQDLVACRLSRDNIFAGGQKAARPIIPIVISMVAIIGLALLVSFKLFRVGITRTVPWALHQSSRVLPAMGNGSLTVERIHQLVLGQDFDEALSLGESWLKKYPHGELETTADILTYLQTIERSHGHLDKSYQYCNRELSLLDASKRTDREILRRQVDCLLDFAGLYDLVKVQKRILRELPSSSAVASKNNNEAELKALSKIPFGQRNEYALLAWKRIEQSPIDDYIKMQLKLNVLPQLMSSDLPIKEKEGYLKKFLSYLKAAKRLMDYDSVTSEIAVLEYLSFACHRNAGEFNGSVSEMNYARANMLSALRLLTNFEEYLGDDVFLPKQLPDLKDTSRLRSARRVLQQESDILVNLSIIERLGKNSTKSQQYASQAMKVLDSPVLDVGSRFERKLELLNMFSQTALSQKALRETTEQMFLLLQDPKPNDFYNRWVRTRTLCYLAITEKDKLHDKILARRHFQQVVAEIDAMPLADNGAMLEQKNFIRKIAQDQLKQL